MTDRSHDLLGRLTIPRVALIAAPLLNAYDVTPSWVASARLLARSASSQSGSCHRMHASYHTTMWQLRRRVRLGARPVFRGECYERSERAVGHAAALAISSASRASASRSSGGPSARNGAPTLTRKRAA